MSRKAIAALVLGLLSLVTGLLAGIPAIILARLAFRDIKRGGGRLGGKRMASAAETLGAVTSILSCLLMGPVLKILDVRQAGQRHVVDRNLEQIGSAMWAFEAIHNGGLPRPTPDHEGRTMLSWRVQVCPFVDVDGDDIYRSLHHDEPWDSPHNLALLTRMPKAFAHSKHPDENARGLTYYRVFVGTHTAFPPGQTTKIPDSFPNSLSNTILVVEAAEAVPWTKPDELEYDVDRPLPKLGGHFTDVFGTPLYFHVLLANGKVQQVNSKVSEQALRDAINPNSGAEPDPNWGWR